MRNHLYQPSVFCYGFFFQKYFLIRKKMKQWEEQARGEKRAADLYSRQKREMEAQMFVLGHMSNEKQTTLGVHDGILFISLARSLCAKSCLFRFFLQSHLHASSQIQGYRRCFICLF